VGLGVGVGEAVNGGNGADDIMLVRGGVAINGAVAPAVALVSREAPATGDIMPDDVATLVLVVGAQEGESE
jgi:hypothetical protein